MPALPDQLPPGLRLTIGRWLIQSRTQNTILALIVVNAVLMGLETSSALMAQWGHWILPLDRAILAVFVLEIVLRLFVHRGRFFRDAWSIFDFVVVTIALVPASGPLAVLRALRVLRVLRILTVVPSMRRVVGALLGAVPGLVSIGAVLLLIFYVFAVIATHLYGAGFPDWFGNLGRSFYTLFQVMTLESWSMGIARPVMEQAPLAWAFFIPFILFATFTMLNLFIAIIVNAMQTFSEDEHQHTQEMLDQTRDSIEHQLHDEVQSLREEIKQFKMLLQAHPALGLQSAAQPAPPSA